MQKTSSSILSSVKEDDTVSVYVFGEEEDKLETEAKRNGGFINYEHLANHFGGNDLPNLIEARKKTQLRRQSLIGGKLPGLPAVGGRFPPSLPTLSERSSALPTVTEQNLSNNDDADNQVQKSRACIVQ